MATAAAKSATVNARRRKLLTGHLTVRQKTLIHNVHQNIGRDFPNIGATEQKKKTAQNTGFSLSTIYNLLGEVQSTGHVSPRKKGKHEERILGEHAKYLIRRTVHQFFMKQILATIDAVHEEIKQNSEIPKMGHSKLHKVLKKLEFRFKRRGRKSLLIDRPEITVWRAKFLHEIKKFRSQGRKIFYLDETWINEGHTNLTLLSKTGRVCKDSFFIHVDVEAEFFIFKPTATSQKLLKGVVNKKSKDHIGCLVHNIFNVSLPKPKHAEDWIGHVLELQRDVMVRITYTNFDGKLPYLRGEIVRDEEEQILEEGVEEIAEDNVGKKRKKRKKENEDQENETPAKKKKIQTKKRG